jgi:predicted site-specific integrase-resolvase
MSTEREPFVDAEKAAEFIGFNPNTVTRFAREGKLPGHPIGSGPRKTWRFRLSELEEALRKLNNASAHPCRQ